MREPDSFAAAIFDVEGTLVDCAAMQLESWREALAAAGHRFTQADLQPYSGMDGLWMLEQLVPGDSAQTKQALVKRQGEIYKAEYLPRVRPFPAVRDLFEMLKGEGVALGLATSCEKDEVAAYDKLINVLELVDALACGEMVSHGKPDPSLLSDCLQQLKTESTRVVVIGDSPYDARAAKLLDLHAVGVLTGGFSRTSLSEAGCNWVFQHVREVSSLWRLPTGPTLQTSS